MKRVIRYGVFETNSSSTHSMSLCFKGENEEWRKEKEIPEEEREVRSPLHKFFVITGLLEQYQYQIENDYDIKYKQPLLNQIKVFKEFLAEEFKNIGGNINEYNGHIEDLRKSGCKDFLCDTYFNHSPLCDCDCSLSLFKNLKKVLQVKQNSDEEFKKAAKIFFNPNVYFHLEEGWFGGAPWYIDEKIF